MPSLFFLLNGASGIVDEVSPAIPISVGTSTVSTVQAKYGGNSILSPVSGGLAGWVIDTSTPTPGLHSKVKSIFSSDFTIELWVWFDTDTSPDGFVSPLVQFGAYSTSLGYNYSFRVEQLSGAASGYRRLRFNEYEITGYTSTSVDLSFSQWHHIALVNSSGTWSAYADGVRVSQTLGLPATFDADNDIYASSVAAGCYMDDVCLWAGALYNGATYTTPSARTVEVYVNGCNLVAPSPTLTASGGPSPYAHLTAPSPTLLAACGALLTLTAPRPRLRFSAHNSTGEQAAHLTAPSPTLTFYAGANAKLKAPRPALSASGTVTISAKAALRAPLPTLQATGTVTGMATAYLTYGYANGGNYGLTAYGGAVATVKPPRPTLSASGTVGSVVRCVLAAPRPKLISYGGGRAALTAPAPSLIADALVGGNASFKLTAPAPTLSSASGAQLTLTAPSPVLSATGYPCGASAHLTAPKPNLVGYGGAVCNITLTGKPTLHATGTTGGVASVSITCPLFELTASASEPNHGSAYLLCPSPRLGNTAHAWLTAPSAKLTAIGSAVVTATYEAYAVNLGHRPRVTNQEVPVDEVTRYTNFPFTHVVRYQNSYYGANSTGLYLLEGTTDDGTAIPWAVKTAMDDFKNPMKKTVAAAYFGGRFGPASTVQLHAGEDTPNTYSFSTPRDRLAQNHRQVFGKGVKERYFALGASGTGTCELDTVELETYNMTRRI